MDCESGVGASGGRVAVADIGGPPLLADDGRGGGGVEIGGVDAPPVDFGAGPLGGGVERGAEASSLAW